MNETHAPDDPDDGADQGDEDGEEREGQAQQPPQGPALAVAAAAHPVSLDPRRPSPPPLRRLDLRRRDQKQSPPRRGWFSCRARALEAREGGPDAAAS
jgi:hypothetical protein